MDDTPASDGLLSQARALGDPTRIRLFRHLASRTDPVDIAELTEVAGLNHNTVRQHLAVLTASGLVVEERETRTRVGRPRLLYHVDPASAERWDAPGNYAWLARLLAEALSHQVSPREAGRLRGRERAHEFAHGAPALDVFATDHARRGFRPRRTDVGTAVQFTLERCPFVDVAAAQPATICQLHLGLAEGLAEALGDWQVDGLSVRPPHEAGCQLWLRPRDDAPAPRA